MLRPKDFLERACRRLDTKATFEFGHDEVHPPHLANVALPHKVCAVVEEEGHSMKVRGEVKGAEFGSPFWSPPCRPFRVSMYA